MRQHCCTLKDKNMHSPCWYFLWLWVRTLILCIYISKQKKICTTRKHSKTQNKITELIQEMCEFGLMTTNCSFWPMSKFSPNLHHPAAIHQQMVAACLSLAKEL